MSLEKSLLEQIQDLELSLDPVMANVGSTLRKQLALASKRCYTAFQLHNLIKVSDNPLDEFEDTSSDALDRVLYIQNRMIECFAVTPTAVAVEKFVAGQLSHRWAGSPRWQDVNKVKRNNEH